MEVLRLVRRLPPETRAYYSKYARENFVNYRELDDPSSLPDLLRRAYTHSSWVLSKVLSFFLSPSFGCVIWLEQSFLGYCYWSASLLVYYSRIQEISERVFRKEHQFWFIFSQLLVELFQGSS